MYIFAAFLCLGLFTMKITCSCFSWEAGTLSKWKKPLVSWWEHRLLLGTTYKPLPSIPHALPCNTALQSKVKGPGHPTNMGFGRPHPGSAITGKTRTCEFKRDFCKMMHGCCISKCSWWRDAANCSQPLCCCSSTQGKALVRLCHHQPDFASPRVPSHHQGNSLAA